MIKCSLNHMLRIFITITKAIVMNNHSIFYFQKYETLSFSYLPTLPYFSVICLIRGSERANVKQIFVYLLQHLLLVKIVIVTAVKKRSILYGCVIVMHGVQRRMISVDILFVILILFFCCVVAICDLVHAVEATYGIPFKSVNSIWKSFLKYE